MAEQPTEIYYYLMENILNPLHSAGADELLWLFRLRKRLGKPKMKFLSEFLLQIWRESFVRLDPNFRPNRFEQLPELRLYNCFEYLLVELGPNHLYFLGYKLRLIPLSQYFHLPTLEEGVVRFYN